MTYFVTVVKNFIGMRIEAYNVTHQFFDKKEEALDFAYNKARELYKTEFRNFDGKIKYKQSGKYAIHDKGYGWAKFAIDVEKFNGSISITENFGTSSKYLIIIEDSTVA